jgi:predicted acetyltransferase
MGVRDGSWFLSGHPVQAGLIGTVCTAEGWRGQKIGSRLLQASFPRMDAAGIALSCLHTSPARHGFYARLGFRKAIIECPRLLLNPALLQDEPPAPGCRIRPAAVEDAAALDTLYAAHYGRGTGAWSRNLPFWQRRLRRQPKLWSRDVTFFLVETDRPVAYIGLIEAAGAVTVCEFGCLSGAEETALDLLRAVLQKPRDSQLLVAELAVSSTDPLRPFVERLGVEDKSTADVIFVRVQNRAAFTEAVAPLLEERAEDAGVEIEVRFGGDRGRLFAGKGRLLRLELDPSDLASLLYNGARLPGLLAQGGLTALPNDPELLAALFPGTGAFRPSLDGY